MKHPPAACLLADLPVSGAAQNARATWPVPPAPVLLANETREFVTSLSNFLVTIFLILASPHAMAEKPEEIKIRISLIAIGDPPQPRYVIRDDRRHLLDTPVSDYPPAEVLVRQKSGDNESFKTVPLGLNSPTGYVSYRGERKLVLFRNDQDSGRSEFASIMLPELRADLTVFLVRNRSSNSWERAPRVLSFDNSLVAFPNDSVRVINLSPIPVRVQINDRRVLEIAANRSTMVRIPRKDQGILSYRIAAVHDGKIYPLIDTATTTMPDTRFNLIVYKSDSVTARAPVDIASYFERPPQKDPQ